MKKRVKVFQAGTYPQGDFNEARVNKIFSNVKTSEGIYAHTSKWLEKNESPLTIGEFSNFTIENGIVTADVEFNEKGASYFNDGVIRGVSVEIQGDNLGKIALLPIGVKPAIMGAEFEELDYAYLDFEEVKEDKLNLDEILKAIPSMTLDDRTKIINTVFGSLTNDEKEGIRQIYWADFEKKEVVKPKTEEEIRADVIKEFELKEKAKNLKVLASKKVFPCLQSIVEFAIDKAILENDTVEFEEAGTKLKITRIEEFEKRFSTMQDATNFRSETNNLEFEEKTKEDLITKSFNETKNFLGGIK